MTELEAYKELVRCSFSVVINLNDTFSYACAESDDIDRDDVEVIIPFIQKYGRSALIAYCSIKCGYDPSIPSELSKEFYSAKEELKKLSETGHILFEQYYERNLKK